MKYLWQTLLCFAAFINSSGGYIAKSANKYSGETCALAPIHVSNWEPWASGCTFTLKVSSIIHGSVRIIEQEVAVPPTKAVEKDEGYTWVKCFIIFFNFKSRSPKFLISLPT